VQLLVSPVLMRAAILPELRATAVASLFALVAAALLAVFSAHLALRPVERIGEAIDTLATGNPLGLTPRREDREVLAIESKLNLLGEQMRGARRDADQTRQAITSLVRGAAHELKNPLNAIALRLEALRARVCDEVPGAEAEIDKLSGEVTRLDRVVRTFLDLGRPVELDLSEFDPAELAASVLELVRPSAAGAGVELELGPPQRRFTLRADKGLVQQGLLNVLSNAIEAMPEGGRVKVAVRLADTRCEIRVTDTGPGIPKEVQERIFDPYFTTKDKGSGIGLAFTRRTMQLHGGAVTVDSEAGRGTTMVLSLPANGSGRA
jgi:signal transduction histidine kinase